MPRTLSDGGAAVGDRIGVQFGCDLSISHPVPAKPSQSIARVSQRMEFLADRQPV
jgi:hypothetical protein